MKTKFQRYFKLYKPRQDLENEPPIEVCLLYKEVDLPFVIQPGWEYSDQSFGYAYVVKRMRIQGSYYVGDTIVEELLISLLEQQDYKYTNKRDFKKTLNLFKARGWIEGCYL